jgi:hypothetical protein
MVTNPSATFPVTYTCRVLPWGLGASLSITVYISLSLMFLGFSLNIPVWLSVFLLVGTMYLIFSKISCPATFTLTAATLNRQLHTDSFLFKRKALLNYTWKDIKSYKEGTDKGRFRGEYQFLEIKFRDGNQWALTDNYGIQRADFSVLLQAFLNKVNEYNTNTAAIPVQTVAGTESKEPKKLIQRKKTIYESIWGKLFTVALGLFIVYIIRYWSDYMGATSMYKMVVILIPGFLYMAYRVFVKEK